MRDALGRGARRDRQDAPNLIQLTTEQIGRKHTLPADPCLSVPCWSIQALLFNRRTQIPLDSWNIAQQGQFEGEGAADGDFALHPNLSAHGLNDLLADV